MIGQQQGNTDYLEFLRAKIDVAEDFGFEIDPGDVHPWFKEHQRDAIVWAVRGGRRALFESFGLGKTGQQLEIMRIIREREGGKALQVCPLEVRAEFAHDAAQIGLTVEYVRTMAEAMASDADIQLTNYERVRDGDIDPSGFTVASLDEASVLRGYGTKTYQEFLRKFRGLRYKFVATATPSPNRYKELIHYAGYLEIMDTGQALTRFFQRDSQKANNLRLYPHREKEFWLWMSSWALFLTKPSDLGYSDDGYSLPPIQVNYHELPVDHSSAGADRDGQAEMFRESATSLQAASREKRESIHARVEKAREIVDEHAEQSFILWHDLEAERLAIMRRFSDMDIAEIYGSQEPEHRALNSIEFREGRRQILATKPELSGSGVNYQYHCHRAVFVGIGYKFNDFIQAIHRIYRYQQERQVIVDIIYMESERQILDVLIEKWKKHESMVSRMTEIIQEHGLGTGSVVEKLARTFAMQRQEESGKHFKAINRDSVLETREMEENSVDLIHTSIPFGNHYEYSATYNDFGHTQDNEHFFRQMDYLTPELFRILKPGRVAAVHVKDRILFGNATGTGMPTVDPFSDLTTAHFMEHGFQFFGRITIVTDVVRENAQTYRLGWTENSKDGTKMGVGCPEYVLLFRKLPSDTSTAYADEPVDKSKDEYGRGQWQIDAHAFWRSSGDRLASPDELYSMPIDKLQSVYREWSKNNIYDYREHVKLAEYLNDKGKLPSGFMVIAPGSWHPDVWDDVNRMRTLNGEQARKQLAYHVCPLQFDVVQRIINRFSKPGEVVCDPFAGLMTVPYKAVEMGRKGIGIELNPDYWNDGLRYLRDVDVQVNAPTLFEFLEMEEGA